MNELSLFSGAGGGLLGTRRLGFRAVGYVEWDDYCQRVIAQRIRDGLLEPAPIFGDIRTFNREGFAASYQGMVDVLTAGFPCQPFSVAGKREGEDDERNMWPDTIETIRLVRPQFCLLENVPGLLSPIRYETYRPVPGGLVLPHFEEVPIVRTPYAGRVFDELAEAGFDAEWLVLGADDCGAPHQRKRLWLLAHSTRDGW